MCSFSSFYLFNFIAEKSGGLKPNGILKCIFLYRETFGVLSKISLFVLEISGIVLLFFFLVFIG
jgi:hypothetical protein